jgi:hypothetical protein
VDALLLTRAMHPAIRILIVLVVAGLMVTGSPWALITGLTLSILLHLAAGLGLAADMPRMILRMRWFLLSILILYAWFMPGDAFLRALGALSPSQQGLAEGLVRCSVLIVILSLVHWLVGASSRQQLIQGIYWLAGPLIWLGVKPQTMAVRLVLVLEAVPLVQRKLQNRPQIADADATRTGRIVAQAVGVVTAALNEADSAELVEIELPAGRPPSPGEWMILAATAASMTMVLMLPA